MDWNLHIEQIVQKLAEYWPQHKAARFLDYLKDTFGTRPLASPHFDCIYIAQAEDGDATKGWIGGSIKQWWIVDDNGTLPISNPELPILLHEPENLRFGFFPKPVLKFFFEHERITIGESFGPDYICRKTARLTLSKNGITELMGCHIIWNSASLARTASRLAED